MPGIANDQVPDGLLIGDALLPHPAAAVQRTEERSFLDMGSLEPIIVLSVANIPNGANAAPQMSEFFK